MALNTSITRNGEPLSLRWGWWHVTCMAITRAEEDGAVQADEREKMSNALDEIENIRARLQYSQDPAVLDTLSNEVLRLYDIFWGRVWDHFWNSSWWNEGYVVQEDRRFVDTSDGEVLELKKGDVLWANISGRENVDA